MSTPEDASLTGEETPMLPAHVRAARSQPCPFCGAEMGQPCRTPKGKTTYSHSARSNITRHAQNIGYEEGLREALSLLDWDRRNSGARCSVESIRHLIVRDIEMVSRHNKREEDQR